MEHDLAVRGNIVLPNGVAEDGWLTAHDGRITGIDRPAASPPRAAHIIDAGGKWVLPGGIDAHVHSGSSAEHTEGFTRLTQAAALGGVTTVIDMPYDASRPVTTIERLQEKIEEVESTCVVDAALFGTVSKHDGWKQIIPLARGGVCGFKFSTYETDPLRFPKIDDYELIKIFKEAQKTDRTVSFHAENGEIIDPLIEELGPLGEEHPEAHCWSRPPLSETTAVAKLLEIARCSPVKLHIVHLTVPFAYDLIDWYREAGVDVTAETCTQYLVLDESHLRSLKGRAKCNPPLRQCSDVEELWEKLFSGSLDFVTSDHAPWPESAKLHDNIFDNSSGLPGVGHLVPVLYDQAVARRGVDIVHFGRLIATNPAKRYDLYPRKGALIVGADADITIIDPAANVTVDASTSPSTANWSPFDGMKLQGKVEMTVVRGEPIVAAGRLQAEPGYGRFVSP